MARISNFSLNTVFTGLKQLTSAYSTRLTFGGRTYTSSTGGIMNIGKATVSIPSGVYIDTVLIKSSYQSKNYVGHYVAIALGSGNTLYYTVSRTSTTQYTLSADLYLNSGASVTLPSSTLEAIIRLATSPFN